MEIRILGPIEAWVDGRSVPLAGPRQRTVLALLATHNNEVVSADRLIDDLWSGEPPETARKSLQVYVSRLRKLLGDTDSAPLVTRPPGYLLSLGPEQLDSLRFGTLAREGHRLIATDPEGAADRLREALALWRGPALHDLDGEPALAAEIARLEEERTAALEDRIDADLALGRHAELIGELDGLVHLFPLRERFTGQLMLALYRSGRQADALRVCQDARRRLADELGLDLSPELQTLEEQILDHDSRLEPPVRGGARGLGPVMRGYELRERLDADPWGVRYLGYQPATGIEVVVKVVDRGLADRPEFIRRFEHEAKRLAQLDGPGIVPLIDFWRDQDGAFLVSARPPGSTLEARIDEDGGHSTRDVIERLSAAMRRAHAAGVVHGNLGPSKVVLGTDGGAALSDFGLLHDLVLGATPGPEQDLATLSQMLGAAPVPIGAVAATAGASPDVDAPPLPSTIGDRNPYKGLRPFHEADAGDFFGREELVDRLVGHLSRPGAAGRMVAVVGPSGSGKSSLVLAGLLPALDAGRVPESERWFLARMLPGERPFEELEATLLRLAVNAPVSLLEQLTDGDTGIHRAVSRVLPNEESTLLLVIDQFEELFTAAPREVADQFLDGLASALTERHGRLRLIVTVRADFYERPMMHPRFGELLRAGTIVVDPLSTEGLDRAIVGPASRVGVSVEPAVVAEMLADVSGRPGALPLLQYALTELFERRSGRRLTLDRYREIGGVQGALVTRAEHLFGELTLAQQQAAHQVFLRLVALDESGEVIRRRVRRSELADIQLDRTAIEQVLDRFGAARLLTFDRDRATRSPTVEVAHEALIDSWARLRNWTEQAAADLASHRRLASSAREWIDSERSDDYLLAGRRLEELESWSRQSQVTLTGEERAFLAASTGRRSSEERQELERLAHERDLEHRSASRLRILVVAMAAASVVGLALTLFALDRGADATREGARAEAVGLSAAAVANADIDSQLALNLALQAAAVAIDAGLPLPTETESALHQALQAERVTYPVADAPVAAVAAPGGTRGIYRLPAGELLELAGSNVTRDLAAEECQTYLGTGECPAATDRIATATAVEADDGERAGSRPLEGTTVSMLVGPVADGIAASLRPLEESTGITVEIESSDNLEVALAERIESGEVPDLAAVPQPAWIPALAADDQLIDLGTYLDPDQIARDFPPYLRSILTVGDGRAWPSADGRLLAVPMGLNNKSLIWYVPAAFQEAGYSVPATWSELIALSGRMATEGNVPWCVGQESGEADGWPATDWIENILLGAGGPEVYDQWLAHEIPFDHPAVVDAARMMGQIHFPEGYVQGGLDQALHREIWVAGWPMFDEPPGCWMHQFIAGADETYPPEVRMGIDAATFPFPVIDPAFSKVTMGGGDTVLAFNDRPEVRAVVQHIASPEWGAEWAGDPDFGAFAPANTRFDLDHFADDLQREHARQIQEALRADAFRFDASDLMPPDVGAGSFWSGMMDYLRSGPDSVERVLADIEASWPADS